MGRNCLTEIKQNEGTWACDIVHIWSYMFVSEC